MKPALIADYEQQRVIIKGITQQLAVKATNAKHLALLETAKLVVLEDIVGDKQFSLLLAMSIPESCQYLAPQEIEVNMCDEITMVRTMQLLRTKYYVAGVRSKPKPYSKST